MKNEQTNSAGGWVFADPATKRIKELLAKIPVGTFCSEDNNCGGYLTAAENDELDRLLKRHFGEKDLG